MPRSFWEPFKPIRCKHKRNTTHYTYDDAAPASPPLQVEKSKESVVFTSNLASSIAQPCPAMKHGPRDLLLHGLFGDIEPFSDLSHG